MFNEKTTKNIITKETIANELKTKDKKSILPLIGLALVYIIVAGAVFSIIYFLGIKEVDGTIGHVIFFVCLFVFLLPIFAFVSLICASMTGSKGQNNKSFCVITDEVVYKEEITYLRRRTMLIKEVLHFSRCGDVEVNHTWYQLTSEKDVYYMVIREGDPRRVLRCYPAKLYEYKE